MILRAIFWIGVVAILMPHEPALGAPHAAGLVDSLKATALHRLLDVRAELAQAEQQRERSAN